MQKSKVKNCILYLVFKYENDKWKLEIRPALAGLKLRNSKLGENFILLLRADRNCYSDESQNLPDPESSSG